MKVLQINSVYPTKSTGKIAYQIAEVQKSHGITPYIAAGDCFAEGDNLYAMDTKLYRKVNILKTRLFGKHGFYNKSATRKLLRWIDKVQPDVIHLHNIHGHYLNVKLLFEYIKEHEIPVLWTLHDCWAFTGHCSHFDYIGCNKWLEGCHHCSLKADYPISWFFDRSKGNYKAKKELFTAPHKMHITLPSKWHKSLCDKSFLNKYPITVVNNGISLDAFKPTESDIRKEMGIEDKFVILAIVNNLAGTKGGQYLPELAKYLKEDECIVLLTLGDAGEDLPANIYLAPKTSDPEKLARLYTMADVFVNPSLQETFSLINLESIACGTPVVTFDSGGGLESQSEKTGVAVKRADVKGMYEGIERVRRGEFKKEDCIQRAREFDYKLKYEQFIDIYKELLDD